jgi:hypothetical protein
MAPPTQLSDLRPGRTLKVVFFATGTAVFLGAGVCVAAFASHFQSQGLPMPRGKAGSLSYREGYGIASAMGLVSIAYAWKTWTLVCSKRD